jgi:predicted DNA-binding transcriptional regulator AlpA
VTDRFVGLAELAELLGVSKVTAVRYTARGDFPAPLQRLASGPIWRQADVEAWAADHLPLKTGRPRKRRED